MLKNILLDFAADHNDLLKTLQRKETELNILYDAYQEQIKRERKQRLAVQRELDQVKNSNAELLQNIERKKVEMKILHGKLVSSPGSFLYNNLE